MRQTRERRKRREKRIFIIAAAAVSVAALAVLIFATDVFKRTPDATPAPTNFPAATATAAPANTPDAAETDAGVTPNATAAATPEPTEEAPLEAKRTLYEATLDIAANAKTPTVDGTLRVSYVNNSEDTLYEIVFRLYPNAVAQGSFTVERTAVNDTRCAHDIEGDDGSILVLPLDMEIHPGESTQLTIDFSASIPATGSRFGVNTTGIMLGNFLPIAAVYENGAWRKDAYTDVGDAFFSECADYKLAVTVPKYWTLAYTGSLIETVEGDGVVTSCIAASNVRDCALALLHDPSVAERVSGDGVKVYAFGLSQEKAEFAAETAAAALDYFSQNIGGYPYSTFFVVPFDQGGGMEYPGLIMVCEKSLHTKDRSEGTMVIGHEAAHQWFYGVVGSDQLKSPWLDESLVEFLGMDFAKLQLDEDEASALIEARYGSGADYERIQRIDSPLSAFVSADYYQVIYVKGARMFEELSNLLGHEGFYMGLKNYYEANAYSVATLEDLVDAFAPLGGTSTAEWFEQHLK